MKTLFALSVLAMTISSSFAGTYVYCTDSNGKELAYDTVDVVRLEKGKLKLQNYSTSYADSSKVRTVKTVPATANCEIVNSVPFHVE